jgi:putative intracellular protease/amidase
LHDRRASLDTHNCFDVVPASFETAVVTFVQHDGPSDNSVSERATLVAQILIPIPARDFDPTEAAVSWQILQWLGHTVIFATPDGGTAQADEMMVSGQGLDLWGFIPVLRRFPLLGLLMRADRNGRGAYATMMDDPRFKAPLKWADIDAGKFDGLLLPGGHRARGMRPYLESPVLQRAVAEFFAADKPVAAICHGVLLVARSISKGTGKSVLYGRKTTALTWTMEKAAASVGRMIRFWDPLYYRTYHEEAGQSPGYMSVQAEVTRALEKPGDFLDVPRGAPNYRKKTSGLHRDTLEDSSPAFVVQDRNYVSARWPGDAHTFANAFAALLSQSQSKSGKRYRDP